MSDNLIPRLFFSALALVAANAILICWRALA